MKILEHRPSKETAYVIHAVFFNFYCLLLGRAVLVFSGIRLNNDSWQQRLGVLEKLSEEMFFSIGLYNVHFDGETHLPTFTVNLICTFAAFLTIHRGMFMDITPKPETSWADKVLKVCRALFFLLGSLLLVLMLIRMGYAFYEQLTPSTLRLIKLPKNN